MLSTTPSSTEPRFPWGGLVALAVASFLSISGEMLPTGLLPEMGADLGVSESSIGLLVSVFALTVVLTSTLLTKTLSRIPRHRLLVVLILVIAVGAVGTALAPSFGWLVGARVLGGLAHGVFWAITGAYAAHLVPRAQVGRALAVSSSGGTLAFVLGVPLGTALGQALGWRLAFAVLAGLMLVGAVLVWRLLPDVGSAADDARAFRQEAREAATGATPLGPGALATGSIGVIREGRRPVRLPEPSVLGVALTCFVTGVFMLGHYSMYTFIAPFLVRTSGVPEALLSPALFAYGIAGAGGLVLVGLFLGRRPEISIPAAMAVVAIVVAALFAFEGRPVASFVVFLVLGLVFGALPPLLQTRLLQVAPARIRDLASSFYTASFNAGIGLGALVGSFVLSGYGLGALPVLDFVVAVVILGVVLVSDRVLRRRQLQRRVDQPFTGSTPARRPLARIRAIRRRRAEP